NHRGRSMASVRNPLPAASAAMEPAYLPGFGNEHVSEALPGALPAGRFSPQRCPYGLYAEKFSSTSFTTARAHNRRTWLYRIRPSVTHGDFAPMDGGLIRSGPITEAAAPPNRMRWDPFPFPARPADFVEGLVTLAANGDV